MKTVKANPSQIQALLFDREAFTPATLRDFMRRNKFQGGEIDPEETGGDYYHVRLRDPSEFKRIRTLTFKTGVLARVGFR